jgi:SAM-dependent methyltransferase
LKLRRINRDEYPELTEYSDSEIWNEIGPGGLYLATHMVRLLNLKKRERVLDLGCGKGETSIFLTKHYDVDVIAVDLWSSANYLYEKFSKQGYDSIIPLNLDAKLQLPFAEQYFDAIFCMNSLSFFGGNVEALTRLSSHLKTGGIFCVGGETLSEEFTSEQLENPPEVYNFAKGVWEGDFLKLHSPVWWNILFNEVKGIEVLSWGELPNGRIMYEDQIQHSQSEGYLGLNAKQARDLELRQIQYGRNHEPYMTIYTLAAQKM